MKKLALTMTACAALALTGCGDDAAKKSDDAAPATTAPATLTKAEFVKQADKICADATKKIDAAGESLGDSPDVDAIKAFALETVVPATKDVAAKIDELAAPAEIADQVDAMLAEVNSELTKVEADWEYALADESFVKADKMATDLGLPSCAS